MKPKTRPMQQGDIDSVYAIETASHRAPWSREILSDCVLVGYDCRVLELKEKKQKQIIGYVICRHSLTVCHILNICISPFNQGKGYGTLLLKSVLDSLSSKQNINSVILEVRPSNLAALALYKKFGFQEDTIKKGYYINGESFEDAIVLKKTIT
ncbi:MAG: ribosomal protein S18-alanine N-acetyltransferase [Tatlockia sp.]|nr:ribosomal protein S18-alanine N-acetyltransferase [Tatlockia sp.]